MEIRAIQPSDRKRYESILARTSDHDLYCRFFHVVDHFDPAEIDRFVEPQADIIGFIALDGECGLGVVHASLLDEETAELAIVVANDVRLQGVGRQLIGRLKEELLARGYRRLIAYALAENRGMAQLAKLVGMHSDGISASVITWASDLAPAA